MLMSRTRVRGCTTPRVRSDGDLARNESRLRTRACRWPGASYLTSLPLQTYFHMPCSIGAPHRFTTIHHCNPRLAAVMQQ